MTDKALIVMDFQKAILGNYEYVEKYNLIGKTNKLIDYARASGILIIFVKVGFSDTYLEMPNNSPVFQAAKANERLKLSNLDTDIDPRMHYKPDDILITKSRFCAFAGTALDEILRANKIEHLYLSGFSTNICVDSTARYAHDLNYKITIVEDACGTWDEENQQRAPSVLKHFTEIKKVDELI